MSELDELDYDQDPELFENNEEGTGDDDAYDGEAVAFIEYDHSHFVLSEEEQEVVEDEHAESPT